MEVSAIIFQNKSESLRRERIRERENAKLDGELVEVAFLTLFMQKRVTQHTLTLVHAVDVGGQRQMENFQKYLTFGHFVRT